MSRWRGLVLLSLAPAIYLVQREVDARREADAGREAARHHEERLVWSGPAVRMLYPGFENVMAGVYWLRAVQYYGGERAFNPGSRFELLEPLIDTTVTLDERFLLAYRYGAIFLAEHWPAGAGKPRAARDLLLKGMASNPESWRLRWDLGIVYHLFLSEDELAAEVLLEGAELPDAPYWLRTMAARILSDADDRQTARLIWEQLLRESEGAMRLNAESNLQALDAAEVLDAFRERLARWRADRGRFPDSLTAVRGGGPSALPLEDPTGVPFRYDADEGSVTLGPRSSLRSMLPQHERALEMR